MYGNFLVGDFKIISLGLLSSESFMIIIQCFLWWSLFLEWKSAVVNTLYPLRCCSSQIFPTMGQIKENLNTNCFPKPLQHQGTSQVSTSSYILKTGSLQLIFRRALMLEMAINVDNELQGWQWSPHSSPQEFSSTPQQSSLSLQEEPMQLNIA